MNITMDTQVRSITLLCAKVERELMVGTDIPVGSTVRHTHRAIEGGHIVAYTTSDECLYEYNRASTNAVNNELGGGFVVTEVCHKVCVGPTMTVYCDRTIPVSTIVYGATDLVSLVDTLTSTGLLDDEIQQVINFYFEYRKSGGGGGTPVVSVQADLSQIDSTKPDFVKGKEAIDAKIKNYAIPILEKGAASGVATLDVHGKVTASQLPSIPSKVSELENDSNYLVDETDPTVPAWAKEPNRPIYTASDVGADASGTASRLVSLHNTENSAHNDIRLLIQGLTARLDALANSTDDDLDQLAEIVAYIKNNKALIDSITTSKVSVADIINNLTTNVSDKPLSAAMGVALKALIDAIDVPTKLSQLENDVGYLTQHQDLSSYAKKTDIPTTDSALSSSSTNPVQNKVVNAALSNKADKSQAIFYIEGTGDTAGIWLGSHSDIASYYNGLTIAYKVGIAGASNLTLNINNLGAVPVVRNVSTDVTTHYGVNSVVILTYTDDDGTARWKISDYDSDTKTRSSNKVDAKMFIIGASSQSTSGQTTYSNKNCYIGADNCLYSNGVKVATTDDIPTDADTVDGKHLVVASSAPTTNDTSIITIVV